MAKKNIQGEVEKQLYIGRLIISIIIATFLFVGVFTFGYFVAFENYESLSSRQEVILNSILEAQVERELIKDFCTDVQLTQLSEELNNMVSIMGQLEKQLGKENAEVIEQKKRFTILQMQHFLLVNERNKNCNNENPVVLFFYSNQKEYLDDAERVGYMVTNLKQNNPEIMVYSIDTDLDSSLVRSLKKNFGVTEPNTVVIGAMKLVNPQNVNELSTALGEQRSIEELKQVIILNQ